MKTVEVEILNQKQQKIRGFLYLPDQPADRTSCVVVSNGFTSSIESNIHTAIAFLENNIACLLFDFCGGSKAALSEGNFRDVSVQTEVSDLESVIHWVRSNYHFRDLFLMGSSMGGFVSAIVAAKEKDIRGLMLVFPAFVIPDDARAILRNDGSIREDSPALRESLPLPVLKEHAALDFEKEIRDYHGPVLIIHGTADPIVSLDYSKRALNVYDHADLSIYPGQGHGFDWKHKVMADKECVDFVEKYS